MKRYYELDVDGRTIGSYARQQTGKYLILLDDPEKDFQKYNKISKKWVEDTELKAEKEATQEKEILIQNKLRQIAIDALVVDGVWTE